MNFTHEIENTMLVYRRQSPATDLLSAMMSRASNCDSLVCVISSSIS